MATRNTLGAPAASAGQRYTMVLDETALKTIERLQAAYRLKNKADAYELAVRVLAWVTDQTAGGYQVGRCKEDGDVFQPLLLTYDVDKNAWNETRPQTSGVRQAGSAQRGFAAA